MHEQVAHVSQALLQGAKRFAAALSNVSVVRTRLDSNTGAQKLSRLG